MSFHSIPLGAKSPEAINAVIEIPKGSSNKFEYDEALDEIHLDRVLHSPIHYPLDYGFIPKTRSEDGDHLDVLVIVSTPLFPGCVVSVRPIGAIDMEDEAGQDWKILAVAEHDPRSASIQSLDALDDHFRKEIEHFLGEYKKLEGKWVALHGWLDKREAHRRIKEGAARFAAEQRGHAG